MDSLKRTYFIMLAPAAATILSALYGIYYYYPSLRRILYDRRLFRVQ